MHTRKSVAILTKNTRFVGTSTPTTDAANARVAGNTAVIKASKPATNHQTACRSRNLRRRSISITMKRVSEAAPMPRI